MASRNESLRGEVNPILTQQVIGYKAQNFIARKIAPVFKSLTESGTMMKLGKQAHMLYDTKRALRADGKKAHVDYNKDTYQCLEHTIEMPLDYQEIEIAQTYGMEKVLDLEKTAALQGRHIIEAELEYAVASLLFSATYYASGNYTTLTGTGKWSDVTTGASHPFTNIETGIVAARADMGAEPNTIIFGYQAWLDFKNHPDVVERLGKYVSGPVMVTPALAAEWLGFKNVFIGEAAYSSDAGVFTDLWGDNVALIRIPDNMDLMLPGDTPHTVIIEQIGYPEVRTWNGKYVRDIINTDKYVAKNIDTGYGYLIIDTH